MSEKELAILKCAECGAIVEVIDECTCAREQLDHLVSGRICNARLEFDGYCRNCYAAFKKAN